MGTTGHYMKKKKSLDFCLISFTKISARWITDLSVKYKTLKLLDDKIGKILGDLGFGNQFLNKLPKA